jgi:hypothetical protein
MRFADRPVKASKMRLEQPNPAIKAVTGSKTRPAGHPVKYGLWPVDLKASRGDQVDLAR